jgi:hypothetical protein
VEAHGVVRRRGSLIFWTIGSQMAVRLSFYAPAAFYLKEDSSYSFLLEPSTNYDTAFSVIIIIIIIV